MMLLAQALQGLVDMDTDLLLLINGMHNAFFDSFMSAYSSKLVWVPLYASILYVIFRNFSWRVALLCVVAVALTITFADQVCSSAIRPAVERLRPSRTPELDGLVHIVNGYRGGRYGFPSCHAANTFGLACFLGLLLRKRWLTVYMVFWALLTCYSRAYLGVHYPGDLLVGALVGSAGAFLMYRLFAWCSSYKRPDVVKGYAWPIAVGLLLTGGMLVIPFFI